MLNNHVTRCTSFHFTTVRGKHNFTANYKRYTSHTHTNTYAWIHTSTVKQWNNQNTNHQSLVEKYLLTLIVDSEQYNCTDFVFIEKRFLLQLEWFLETFYDTLNLFLLRRFHSFLIVTHLKRHQMMKTILF